MTSSNGNTLQWRYNGRDSVSNHQPHDYLPNRLFRPRSKKTSKLRVTGLCAGNSPVTGALMFSLICAWINGWVSNGKAGDLRRHRARYDVIIMLIYPAVPHGLVCSSMVFFSIREVFTGNSVTAESGHRQYIKSVLHRFSPGTNYAMKHQLKIDRIMIMA